MIRIRKGGEWDLSRFPHEIRRALEAEGSVLVDQIAPGLRARPEEDAVVFLSAEGAELGRVPNYRLRPVDVDTLIDGLRRDLPADVADQAVAALAEGAVEAPPTMDELIIHLGARRLTVHRSVGVPAWPADDVPPAA